MKKGLLITAVLALVFGMALVSCTQDAADSNALVQVSLSASKSKALTYTDEASSRVTSYKLTATSKASSVSNPYSALKDHTANTLVWSQTYVSGTDDEFADIEAGTRIDLGYFSQGTWAFKLEAINGAGTTIFEAQTNSDVYIKNGANNTISLILGYSEGTGSIALGGFQAARTEVEGEFLTIKSTDEDVTIDLKAPAVYTEGSGMVTFGALVPAAENKAAANAIPVGAYTIVVKYGTKAARFGITVVTGGTVTIGKATEILDTETYEDGGLTVTGVAFVKGIGLEAEYATTDGKKTSVTLTCSATTPSSTGITYTWYVNGDKQDGETATFTYTPVSADVNGRYIISCEVSYEAADGVTAKASAQQEIVVLKGIIQ